MRDAVMERVRPRSTLPEEVLGQIQKAAAQEKFSCLSGCPACPDQVTLSVHAPGVGKVVFCRVVTCHHVAADGSRAVCSLHAD